MALCCLQEELDESLIPANLRLHQKDLVLIGSKLHKVIVCHLSLPSHSLLSMHPLSGQQKTVLRSMKEKASLGGRLLKGLELYFSSFFCLKGEKKAASPGAGENQTCQFAFTEGERL